MVSSAWCTLYGLQWVCQTNTGGGDIRAEEVVMSLFGIGFLFPLENDLRLYPSLHIVPAAQCSFHQSDFAILS